MAPSGRYYLRFRSLTIELAIYHLEHNGGTNARWPDDHTLELDLRTGVRFQDGEPFTAHNVKQNFDEMQRWVAPHPPGSWLNFPPESVCDVVNDQMVRFRFPGPEGLALGKMRGFHIASSAFWREQGFGYAKLGSGEGHW